MFGTISAADFVLVRANLGTVLTVLRLARRLPSHHVQLWLGPDLQHHSRAHTRYPTPALRVCCYTARTAGSGCDLATKSRWFIVHARDESPRRWQTGGLRPFLLQDCLPTHLVGSVTTLEEKKWGTYLQRAVGEDRTRYSMDEAAGPSVRHLKEHSQAVACEPELYLYI